MAGGLALVLALVACEPSPGADPALRVGTSGDYAPFSLAVSMAASPGPPRYEGFGPDLARAYAKDRNLAVEFVPFRWPDLVNDLAAGRFDVAMSGVTVRPERSLAGRFTIPVAESGAMALVADDGPLKAFADLHRPGLRMAVNAGGHLERTTRQHFPQASVLPIQNNADVPGALAKGRADVVITDTREAPHWQAQHPGLHAIGPFTRDRKALLVASNQPELARDLDAWLLAAERDGRMAEWRTIALGDPPADSFPRPALSALLAAIHERLVLMPLVAESKRDSGAAVEVPEREARVVDAALAGVRSAEREAGVAAPERLPEAAVRGLFRAQIAAAKSIQRQVLARPRPPGQRPPPDLDGVLRPALLRLGDRIARLVVELPPGIGEDEIRDGAARELEGLDLPPARVDAIANALEALRAPAPQ